MVRFFFCGPQRQLRKVPEGALLKSRGIGASPRSHETLKEGWGKGLYKALPTGLVARVWEHAKMFSSRKRGLLSNQQRLGITLLEKYMLL